MVSTIPNTSLRQGWNDFSADTEFSYDRWGAPQNVRIEDPTTGQYRPLQPGESVPAGARFSVYTSESGALTGSPGPAAGGQETVTGQDLVWQNHQIAMDLAQAQDNMRALDQQDQQIQQQHAQFQANLQQQRDIAQMNAQQQAAQIGVQAAQQQLQARLAELDNEARAAEHNFNQRLSRVQEERAAARLNLDRSVARSEQLLSAEQLNASQRESLANLQQNALGMLADRSGPQDWTRYQYLQENMFSPDPEATTEANPFKMLQDFYQPYTPDLKGLEEDYQPNLGGLVQEYQPGSTGGAWQGTLQDAVGQAQGAAGLLGGQAPQVQAPTSTRMGGNDPYPQGGGQQPPAGGGNVVDPSGGIANSSLSAGWNLVTVPEGGGITADRFDPRFEVWVQDPGASEPRRLQPGETAPGGAGIWVKTPDDFNPQGGAPAGAAASGGIANASLEPGRNLVTVPEGGGIGYDRFDPRFDVYAQRDGEYVQLGPGDRARGGEGIWINTPQDYNPSSEPQVQAMSQPMAGSGGSSPQDVQRRGGLEQANRDQAQRIPYGNDNRTFDAGGGMLQGNDWGNGPPPGGANTQSPVPVPNNAFSGSFPYGNDNRTFNTSLPGWDEYQRGAQAAQDAGRQGISPGILNSSSAGYDTGRSGWSDYQQRAREARNAGRAGVDPGIFTGGLLQGNDWGNGPPPGGANTQSPVQPPDNPFGTINYGNDTPSFRAPSSGSSVSAPTVESGAQLNDRQRRMMSRYNELRQMNTGGNLLDGQMAIVGDKPGGGRTGYEEAIINTPQGTRVLDRHQTRGLLDGQGMKRMASGGLLQSQDVGGANPNAFTFNQYSDEDLYNQPFLQQVRGERQGRGFGAFGGGNRVGPFDLPTTPSLGTLSSLSPSALKMTQGAYESPETGMFWDDIIDRARRSSIGTQSTGGLSAFAGYR